MTFTGLLLLYMGGEVLILGAVKFGERIGLSPLVVGLTVVAFATSTPELAVSIEAAMLTCPPRTTPATEGEFQWS